MSRRVPASSLDAEVDTFEAEVRRLALAILDQALQDELARWRTAIATMLSDEALAVAQAEARGAPRRRKR
jgi:hypothetical protein